MPPRLAALELRGERDDASHSGASDEDAFRRRWALPHELAGHFAANRPCHPSLVEPIPSAQGSPLLIDLTDRADLPSVRVLPCGPFPPSWPGAVLASVEDAVLRGHLAVESSTLVDRSRRDAGGPAPVRAWRLR